MLVLTREVGERVLVYDQAGTLLMTIEVVEKRGQLVGLGFDAPPHIQIWREELVKKNPNVLLTPRQQ